MRRLLILGLMVAAAVAYRYPPFDASRLYLYPYWATNPRLDSTHYPFRGYFALFGSDSTAGSFRIYNREATGKGLMARIVSGTADTTRIDSLGIYTNGDIWANTVHYTTLDPPAGGGAADTLKRGLGFLSRGTWTHAGESLATDTSQTWPRAGNSALLQTLDTTAIKSRSLAVDGTAANSELIQTKDTTWIKGLASTFSDTMWYTKQTLTISSGRTSWNMASGGYGRLLLTTNDTLNNPTNVRNGRTYRLKLIQDGTGTRLISWPSNVRFPGSVNPTLTAMRMKADEFTFVGDSDSMLLCLGGSFSITMGDTL